MAGNRPHCVLICRSNSRHLQQLYTGFAQLGRRGEIVLEQRICRPGPPGSARPPELEELRHAQLEVLVDGSLRLCYDTHDSPLIDPADLDRVDYYFKRSYLPGPQLAGRRAAVLPLGLFYTVYADEVDRLALSRSLLLERGRARVVGSLRALRFGPFHSPRAAELEGAPDPAAPARVLFMVRAWDPSDNPARPAERVAERIRLNQMRAECIRALRRELGEAFYGGFAPTPFAARHFPDALLPDGGRARRDRYLGTLRGFPIGIATAGLYGSVGAKFAEYVAYAKAIVSEPLGRAAPGDLAEGHNYLSFTTPEGCVEQARRLIADPDLRAELMRNNRDYYQRYLRPDALVRNTLACARQQAARA